MRAGRGFRMILDTEGGNLEVFHPFQRIVIQVYMRKSDRQVRKRIGIDAVAMIL
jgi:hypothetical protein